MPHYFYLSSRSRKHIKRHFYVGIHSGSHFLIDTFQTPDDLLLFLEHSNPVRTIEQNLNTTLFTYTLTDGRMAGTIGIAKRNQVRKENLITEVRDGFMIEVEEVEELTLTAELCVVARRTNKGLSIITAFPGGYARPFAQKGQPAEEYELNKQFWKEHVLLKPKG